MRHASVSECVFVFVHYTAYKHVNNGHVMLEYRQYGDVMYRVQVTSENLQQLASRRDRNGPERQTGK